MEDQADPKNLSMKKNTRKGEGGVFLQILRTYRFVSVRRQQIIIIPAIWFVIGRASGFCFCFCEADVFCAYRTSEFQS